MAVRSLRWTSSLVDGSLDPNQSITELKTAICTTVGDGILFANPSSVLAGQKMADPGFTWIAYTLLGRTIWTDMSSNFHERDTESLDAY
ncbi:MAG: hypothetical protein JNL29_14500 [Nitrospira sp.]|nr:hypothetical protein [Nitrospira sp.]MBS0167411.1 hypothetical protein [Nitrospira sp.]